ncbi:4-hydroxybutyrate coenzyme A transferase-like [Macrosteles quadrilineatus]|uniref:4-hydroxybutyrate coenzyme A transferase-like n=1 Tax=Macrosteles quadrilineatus TaxID=74068 RepID=UPI0023E2B527|nr:4-hydroxybutyrate coenzyme A transferase-like [Macrosteles quadrilineatus]
MIRYLCKTYVKLTSIPLNLQNVVGRTYFSCPELSQPLQKETKWTTSEEAVKCIKSGDTVFLSGAVATPIQIPEDMAKYAKSAGLKNIKVVHFFTIGDIPYLAPDCKDIFHVVSLFISPNIREAVADGQADVIPIFLSDIPKLFFHGIIKPDVCIVQVSPPDEHGFCTLGTNVEIARSALVSSKLIVAQVNKHMPRTFGDSLVHMSHIDYAVSLDVELIPTTLFSPTPSEGDPEMTISKLIGDNLVEDGATVQTGFGKIPDGIMLSLKNHKDIGVHTEMFTDGVMNLVKSGVITNNKKTLSQGKITTSFFHGSSELYQFADNNPLIEMRVADYTNSQYIISKHPKMTAINACIEVDLTGQVVSDSIGTMMYSGFGGQLDFIKGAADGFDGKGKPIIATTSVDKNTGESKIVAILRPGSGVVVTRGHIHYVVTEFGIASLFGKTLRQRAHALISVAHPNHRESLEKAAFARFKAMPCP